MEMHRHSASVSLQQTFSGNYVIGAPWKRKSKWWAGWLGEAIWKAKEWNLSRLKSKSIVDFYSVFLHGRSIV